MKTGRHCVLRVPARAKEIMTMNARAFSLFCIAAACLLASSGPVGTAAPPEKKPSPYAGTYTGNFTSSTAAGDQEGEVTLTIDDDGNITGESNNKSINATATIKGQILKDNKSSIVFEFPGQAKYSAFGTFSKTASGGFTGTMAQRTGTTTFASIEYDLKRKAK